MPAVYSNVVSQQQFIDFVRARCEACGLSVLQLERATGDRVRDVLYRHNKPPLATLHKWAKALQLNDAETAELYGLADAAHGGGTIVAWMLDQLRQRDAAIDALVQRIARNLPPEEKRQ